MSLHASSALRRHKALRWTGVATMLFLFTFVLLFALNMDTAQAQDRPLPPAVPTTVAINEDEVKVINTGIPVDPGNRDRVAVTQGPAHGVAIGDPGSLAATYRITYTPGANLNSQVTFGYQICTKAAPAQCGSEATIKIIINPLNDPPQAIKDTASTKVNTPVDIPVLSNDNGGPNESSDTKTLAGIASNPAMGTAAIVGSQIRYTPNANQCGFLDTFTYTVRDSAGLLAVGTVDVNVKCAATPEIKLSDPYQINDHMFLVDITLDSADVDVAAVDFYVDLTDVTAVGCMIDPDVPTNNSLADDVTAMPLAPSFISQVMDEPYPQKLHFAVGGVGNPPSVLAGPSASATRLLATMKLRAAPGCGPTALLDLQQRRNNTNTQDRGFTAPNGQNIIGIVTGKHVDLTTVNSKPTDILLSNNTVQEDVSGAYIGVLSTIDPDVGDTFTYDILSQSDNGINANGYFRIRFGNELAVRTNPVLSPPPPAGTYTATIQTTDSFGAVYTKTFTINVTNVNKAPVANHDGLNSPIPSNPTNIIVRGRTSIAYNPTLRFNDTDPDDAGCANCTIQSVTNGKKGFVTTDGLNIIYTPTDPAHVASGNSKTDVFTYTITDNDPTGPLTASAKVTVTLRPEQANGGGAVIPGDCNKDGVVGAGDLVATAREIFDDPSGKNWYDIPLGNYAFSAYGCNSNLDMFIDVLDLTCTATKIFNNSYVCPQTLVAASNTMTANLAVGTGLTAAPGATVQVPINLSSAGHAVAAAAFAVNFDAATFSFDPADSDGNGVPDAVSLNAPGNAFVMATYNAAASRIEIVITGMTDPMPQLSDGAIATVTLAVNSGATISESAVTLTESSLGDAQAQAIPVAVTDGAIQIANPSANRVLLPLIARQ